jgi:hypothetical protein
LKLLSTNTKLKKQPNGEEWAIAGLSLAPASHSGKNVCPWSTEKCRQACVLWFSGRTVMAPVRDAMIRRTTRFFKDRGGFLKDLKDDLSHLVARYQKTQTPLAVRLNVGSDIAWENVDPGIFKDFPYIQFYDYTKGTQRVVRSLVDSSFPGNYHLTYSLNDSLGSDKTALHVLAYGGRVAVVVAPDFENERYRYIPLKKIKDPFPLSVAYQGAVYRCVDGDEHDLRLPALGETQCLVMLRLKTAGMKHVQVAEASQGFTRRIEDRGKALAPRLSTNKVVSVFFRSL